MGKTVKHRFTWSQLAGMTTTELHDILLNERLAAADIRMIKATLRTREI